MNKLLKTIKENDEGFENEDWLIGTTMDGDIQELDRDAIKSHIHQSRIKELEAIIERAEKVPVGLFDSTPYMKDFIGELRETVEKLRRKNDT